MRFEFGCDKLHGEVWSIPMRTLAKRYGLSDNELRKICIALDIPLPARGHWAKVAAGQPILTPPLRPTDGRTCFVSDPPTSKTASPADAQQDSWLARMLTFEAASENTIVVLRELEKPDRLVATAATRTYSRFRARPCGAW